MDPGAKLNVHEVAADGMVAGTGCGDVGRLATGAWELTQPARHAVESNRHLEIKRISQSSSHRFIAR